MGLSLSTTVTSTYFLIWFHQEFGLAGRGFLLVLEVLQPVNYCIPESTWVCPGLLFGFVFWGFLMVVPEVYITLDCCHLGIAGQPLLSNSVFLQHLFNCCLSWLSLHTPLQGFCILLCQDYLLLARCVECFLLPHQRNFSWDSYAYIGLVTL
jgi:hypothetical protein